MPVYRARPTGSELGRAGLSRLLRRIPELKAAGDGILKMASLAVV
jgi:hypothetical protein